MGVPGGHLFFFQAEEGIRDIGVTGVQTCALPISQAPRLSAVGALARYVSRTETKNFQPVNITFALLEPLANDERRRARRKRDRHELQVNLALKEWDAWLQENQQQRPALQASA